jgi:exonuclease SbcD
MKTAIAAILADSHLKEDNIEVNKSIYRQASEIAKGLGLSQIDHAGDIFNSRKSQSQPVLVTFKEILDELHSNGITLNACVGNHDKTDYSSAESFLDPFSEHPSLNLYRNYGDRKIGNIYLHFLSFFSDDIYIELIKEQTSGAGLPKGCKHVLITHIGIAGSVMNNGTVIESEGITPSLFKDFDLTLVGHFHDAQTLAEGRIKYIGASLQHNFGEMTDKGLTILYDDLSTEIIPLKYPQFIKYEISPKDLTSKDIADIKQEKEASGDNIRIVLTGLEADLKSFNKQILIEAGVSVQHKQEEVVKEDLEQRVEAFDANSLKEEFHVFCEKNKLDLNQGLKYFNKIIHN